MDGFGTGETKSWIAVAGAVHDTGLTMELVDYLPIYRTVAGSGVGATFARWQ
jgi:3-O-methylgallate 3,4-dioxygenase